MSSIRNVAILGASGNLGRLIFAHLVSAGFNVVIITRPDSKLLSVSDYTSSAPCSNVTIEVKTSPYSDLDGLIQAFAGQDAVVEAFNPDAAQHQRTIVRAALAARVSHIITPEFGLDTFNEHIGETLVSGSKIRAQQELEEEIAAEAERTGTQPKLEWTAIIVGGWYDWGIQKGMFWVQKDTKTIIRIGSGNQKYSISRVALNGEAVVEVLRKPEKYRNRPAYFASATLSTNELNDMINKIALARNQEPWNIVDAPIDGMLKIGREMWERDTAAGVQDRLSSEAYRILGTASVFDENNRYGADFSTKVEPSGGEDLEKLRKNLEGLLFQG
ncbi:hypothetical protein BKA56DRAFT_532562 [Ilyonectria sp. MPI-CAGE-AT-0026]|nr:hypothetical protein BKA56DRAFT_532562 [Ilyonectria sp. MPI-CAGE-AT-0026]